MAIIADIKVTFDAVRNNEGGTGPLDIRVVIPKNKYLIVAEDDGYYYLQPVAALQQHTHPSKPLVGRELG